VVISRMTPEQPLQLQEAVEEGEEVNGEQWDAPRARSVLPSRGANANGHGHSRSHQQSPASSRSGVPPSESGWQAAGPAPVTARSQGSSGAGEAGPSRAGDPAAQQRAAVASAGAHAVLPHAASPAHGERPSIARAVGSGLARVSPGSTPRVSLEVPPPPPGAEDPSRPGSAGPGWTCQLDLGSDSRVTPPASAQRVRTSSAAEQRPGSRQAALAPHGGHLPAEARLLTPTVEESAAFGSDGVRGSPLAEHGASQHDLPSSPPGSARQGIGSRGSPRLSARSPTGPAVAGTAPQGPAAIERVDSMPGHIPSFRVHPKEADPTAAAASAPSDVVVPEGGADPPAAVAGPGIRRLSLEPAGRSSPLPAPSMGMSAAAVGGAGGANHHQRGEAGASGPLLLPVRSSRLGPQLAARAPPHAVAAPGGGGVGGDDVLVNYGGGGQGSPRRPTQPTDRAPGAQSPGPSVPSTTVVRAQPQRLAPAFLGVLAAGGWF
jgi:hypothetical protein